MNDALFSSATDEWATPQEVFDLFNERFKFNLDTCATKENAKCKVFFTKEDNGLSKNWGGVFRQRCWMNPPYGNPEKECKKDCKKKKCVKRGYHCEQYVPGIIDWIGKAITEVFAGATVVCLLPSRTDARWFREAWKYASEVYFIKGRLKFGGAKNSAPFPSCVFVLSPKTLKFKEKNINQPIVRILNISEGLP